MPKKTIKVVVYIMILSMLLTTLFAGLGAIF